MSTDINDGGPAFPVGPDQGSAMQVGAGMSLRDYFAAHAPAAWMPEADTSWGTICDEMRLPMCPFNNEIRADYFATHAYAYADAMLKVRAAKK